MIRIRNIANWIAPIVSIEILFVYLYWWVSYGIFSNQHRQDFYTYYAISKQMMGTGFRSVYDFQLQKYFQDQVTNISSNQTILLPHVLPPYTTLIMWPLSLVNYSLSYTLWGIGIILLVTFSIVGLIWNMTWPSKWHALRVGAVLSAFTPLFILLLQGQSDALILFPLSVSAIFWLKGKHELSGLFAALAMTKPNLLLLLPLLFLFRSPKKALPMFLGTSLIMVLLTIPFFGIEGWKGYLHVIFPAVSQGVPGWDASSQSAFSIRAFLVLLPLSSNIILATLALGGAALLYISSQKVALPRLDFALAMLLSWEISPYQHTHDVVLLLCPLILIVNLIYTTYFEKRNFLAFFIAATFIAFEGILFISHYWAALATLGLVLTLLFIRLHQAELIEKTVIDPAS